MQSTAVLIIKHPKRLHDLEQGYKRRQAAIYYRKIKWQMWIYVFHAMHGAPITIIINETGLHHLFLDIWAIVLAICGHK